MLSRSSRPSGSPLLSCLPQRCLVALSCIPFLCSCCRINLTPSVWTKPPVSTLEMHKHWCDTPFSSLEGNWSLICCSTFKASYFVLEIKVQTATAVREPPPCSPIHILKLNQAVQWSVCVFEGKPAVSVRLVCLHTWVGERPRCEARDRKEGEESREEGGGGWM